MRKKKKQQAIYVHPSEEEIRKAIAEIQPMKEEMQSWMGCKKFVLSVLPLQGSLEGLISFTSKLREEYVPEWFSDNRAALSVMDTYLSDVALVLNMVAKLKAAKEEGE